MWPTEQWTGSMLFVVNIESILLVSDYSREFTKLATEIDKFGSSDSKLIR